MFITENNTADKQRRYIKTTGGMEILLDEGKHDGTDGFRADGIKCCLEVCGDENTAAVVLHGEMKEKEPYFGPQNYLDPKKGVTYYIELRGVQKLMVIYQHKDWWIRPSFPAAVGTVPERTQLLLAKTEEEYLAVLCVCGAEYRTDLQGEGDRLLVSCASNCIGKKKAEDLSVVFASGQDPYLCCEMAVKKALALTGREGMLRSRRRFPEMFEYFGWCSWDAFYHEVSAAGIEEKLDELKEKQIPVNWVLIDDGWLDADYKKQVLKGPDAAPDKFPDGLGAFVRKIKAEYGIKQVGVWHAVMGYWNGLEAGSKAEYLLEDGAEKLKDGRIIPAAEAGKAFRFYDTWHEYLKNSCGIDFVKVDGQSAVSLFYSGRKEYGKASGKIQKGLNASAALHFNNCIINCMGMACEDMWNRPSSAVSRSSDDFVPEVEHGFREHAIQNGYNSLLQGQFYWGDWDMFWSRHEENWQNSILRAVSGGPVYTSDRVGCTDREFIDPLIKKDGRIIRCEDTGVPTTDCLFENPVDTTHVLKLFNRYQDIYVIAAFNINKNSEMCEGTVCSTDIPGLAGRAWYLYSYRERTLTPISDKDEYHFCLRPNDAELFLIIPQTGFRALGILEKYIGQGCVEGVWGEGKRTCVQLTEEGTFGFISERAPKEVWCGGERAAVSSWKQTHPGKAEGCAEYYYVPALKNKTEAAESFLIEIVWD